MTYDFVTEGEVIAWHQSNKGFGGRPAGHALRMLREMIEFCVASGASWQEITDAVGAELNKAQERGEFEAPKTYRGALEEYVDVRLLSMIYRCYFIATPDLENMMRQKMETIRGRRWAADRDGVLWRPERLQEQTPAATPGDVPKAP